MNRSLISKKRNRKVKNVQLHVLSHHFELTRISPELSNCLVNTLRHFDVYDSTFRTCSINPPWHNHSLAFPRQIHFFAMILMFKYNFLNLPITWNKETSHKMKSKLLKGNYVHINIDMSKLSLIVELVTHLQICRTSISGPDSRSIIWWLETS